MVEALRFTTLRIGVAALKVEGQVFESEVRLLRASDGSYRWLGAALSQPLSSLEEAARAAEEIPPESPELSIVVRWRDDSAAPGPGEHPCPVCGAPAAASSRYPLRLCPACMLETTDARGALLRFANASLSGGVEAKYAESGAPYAGPECFVRGVRCRAYEGKFGGVVVQPFVV